MSLRKLHRTESNIEELLKERKKQTEKQQEAPKAKPVDNEDEDGEHQQEIKDSDSDSDDDNDSNEIKSKHEVKKESQEPLLVKPKPIRAVPGKPLAITIPSHSSPIRPASPAPDSGSLHASITKSEDKKVVEIQGVRIEALPRELCRHYETYRRLTPTYNLLNQRGHVLREKYHQFIHQLQKASPDQKFNICDLERSYQKDCNDLTFLKQSYQWGNKSLRPKIDKLLETIRFKEKIFRISEEIEMIEQEKEAIRNTIPRYEDLLIASLKEQAHLATLAKEGKLDPGIPHFPRAIEAYNTLKVLVHRHNLHVSQALKQMSPLFRPSPVFVPNERLPLPQTVGSLGLSREELRQSPNLLSSYTPCKYHSSHCFFDRETHDAKDRVMISLLRREEVVEALVSSKSIQSLEDAYAYTPHLLGPHRQAVARLNRSQSMPSLQGVGGASNQDSIPKSQPPTPKDSKNKRS